MLMAVSSYQPAYGPDPAGSSVLVAAVSWLQGTLLGTVATSIAIIAVAGVGFMMLTGRLNVRAGATVVLGCFILFGASTIVAGFRSALYAEASGPVAYAPIPRPPANMPPPPVAAQSTPSGGHDPYAGAAVPSL